MRERKGKEKEIETRAIFPVVIHRRYIISVRGKGNIPLRK